MKLVVDANVLFSFFKASSSTRALITQLGFLELYAPSLALEELLKYKELICKKSHIDGEAFDEIIEVLKTFVSFEPVEAFKEFLPETKRISPDPNDVAYFALALKLNCPIWSNDAKLKQQSRVKVFSTKELLKLLGIST